MRWRSSNSRRTASSWSCRGPLTRPWYGILQSLVMENRNDRGVPPKLPSLTRNKPPATTRGRQRKRRFLTSVWNKHDGRNTTRNKTREAVAATSGCPNHSDKNRAYKVHESAANPPKMYGPDFTSTTVGGSEESCTESMNDLMLGVDRSVDRNRRCVCTASRLLVTARVDTHNHTHTP